MANTPHASAVSWPLHAYGITVGRLLETGTEDFLDSKRSGMLGNVPVIAILTKYDMLIDRELTKQKADAEVQANCVGPLKQFAGSGIPHATTSSVYRDSAKEDYEETLNRLIKITESCVGQHSMPEAAVMTSVTQRVDPRLKIKASIEVGKKKYWKALMSCPRFRIRKMWDGLYVLHADIVDVWNFCDPHKYLHGQEFRELMMKIIHTIQAGLTPNLNKTVTSGLSMLGTIVGMMSEPAAPIIVPIPASVVLATWVYEVYQISHAVLQRFMSYIIHLMLVLQTLYLVSDSQGLTRRAIKLAVASYLASPLSGEVHTRIQAYDMQLMILGRADHDTLDKIAEVMQFYSIDETHMSESKLREKPLVDLSSDEPYLNPQVQTFKAQSSPLTIGVHSRSPQRSSVLLGMQGPHPITLQLTVSSLLYVIVPGEASGCLRWKLRASYPIIDHHERFIAPHSLAFNSTANKLYCGFEAAIEIFDIQQPGEGDRLPTTPSKKSKDSLKGIISSVAFSSSYDYHAIGSLTPSSPATNNIALYSEPNQAAITPVGGADFYSGVTQLKFNPTKPHILYAAFRRHDAIYAWDLRSDTSVPVKVFKTSPGPRKTLTNQKIEFDIDYAGRWLSVGDHDGCVSMFDLEGSDELGSEQSPVTLPQNIAPKMTFNAHGGKCIKHPHSSLLSGSRHFDEDRGEGDSNSSDGDSTDRESDFESQKIIALSKRRPLPSPYVKDSSLKLRSFEPTRTVQHA
ncbi:hypothetical protein C8R48DRAFT_777750 [Suillus tomentosus]|nr:hypothetical protein C8R48DRAFT_777750 [Suillus tomentosus]